MGEKMRVLAVVLDLERSSMTENERVLVAEIRRLWRLEGMVDKFVGDRLNDALAVERGQTP